MPAEPLLRSMFLSLRRPSLVVVLVLWLKLVKDVLKVRWRRTLLFFFFQAEDGIRDYKVTGVQTCALPIWALPDGDRGAREPEGRQENPGRPRLAGVADRQDQQERPAPVDRGGQGVEPGRSEERRVGKEGRSRGAPYH